MALMRGISRQGRNLIIAIVAGLVVGAISSFVEIDGSPSIYYLIQVNALVEQGWVVGLFTSILVAPFGGLGIADVVFNAIAVYFVDGLLAAVFTARQYYVIFLITGVAGNLVSLVNPPNTASFGASGGIFGLLAAAVSFDYAFNKRLNSGLLSWFFVVFIFSSFISSSVDWEAHLGGALVGLIAGYYLGSKRRGEAIHSAFYRRFDWQSLPPSNRSE